MTDISGGVAACDVIVVGSGAAGLCAAITAADAGLDVIVAEKTDVFGGTSAWSGGWLWIPRNPLARAAGIEEDAEGPRRYLRHLLGNRAADPRIETFLANGPEMVAYLAEIGVMHWVDGNRMPDFYDHDGALTGGRSVTAAAFDGRDLGPLVDKLRRPLGVVSLDGMGIGSGADMAHFFNATRRPASFLHVAKRLARHARDRVLHRRSMQLVGGNALVAHLLKGAADRGVRLWTQAPVVRVLNDGDRVSGVVLDIDGTERTVITRRGVVLATGGFPHDTARQAGLFPHVATLPHASAAPRTNTGDGIRLGEAAGGSFDDTLAQPGAWAPVSLVPDGKGGHHHFPHLIERSKPGYIAIDAHGRRFVNEADSYHEFTRTLLSVTPDGQTPECWLICDHRAQRQFGLGWAKPFPFPVGPYLRNGYMKRGRTLSDLAHACGLPAEQLADTVERFNANARQGSDPDFHRGETPYNRVQGWSAHRGPNPSLGPLERGPFYAVRIIPGSLGTFAGLRTGATGEVLDAQNAPIPGLYAIGNDAASIMGGHYPSGGITLGPGMTFGYIVGRRLAGLAVTGVPAPLNNSEGDTL